MIAVVHLGSGPAVIGMDAMLVEITPGDPPNGLAMLQEYLRVDPYFNGSESSAHVVFTTETWTMIDGDDGSICSFSDFFEPEALSILQTHSSHPDVPAFVDHMRRANHDDFNLS